MDTSQNSSLSQITQEYTAISESKPAECLPAERRWWRRNLLWRFAVSL